MQLVLQLANMQSQKLTTDLMNIWIEIHNIYLKARRADGYLDDDGEFQIMDEWVDDCEMMKDFESKKVIESLEKVIEGVEDQRLGWMLVSFQLMLLCQPANVYLQEELTTILDYIRDNMEKSEKLMRLRLTDACINCCDESKIGNLSCLPELCLNLIANAL